MITFCVVKAKVFTTAGYSKAVVVCLVDKKKKRRNADGKYSQTGELVSHNRVLRL